MAPFYTLLWLFLAANAGVLVWKQGFGSEIHESSNSFSRFRNNYLVVYSLMMCKFHATCCLPTRCYQRGHL